MQPYQFGNPANDFYIRQAQQHIQPQYQQQTFPFMQQPQQQQFITRFVGNIDEAKAAMIDALSTYLFVDQSTGRIYMKRLSNNGLSEFYIYEISDTGKEQVQKDPIEEINSRLINIEHYLGELKNDKSVSGNAGYDTAGNPTETTPAEARPNETAEPAAFQKGRGNDRWKK